MSSTRPGRMRWCRFHRVVCLVLLEWALLDCPMGSYGVATLVRSDSREPGSWPQVTFLASHAHDRRHRLDAAFTSASFWDRNLAASSMDLAPSPVPPLFPSDPPVTVPFAPPPETLSLPMGNCSINFTSIQTSFFQTTDDCVDPFSPYVAVAICCPQLNSFLRIMQGQHISVTGALGFNDTEAQYCFSETVDALHQRGTSSELASLCRVQPTNLTVGSCPVTDMAKFDEIVNTSYLLQACQGLEPLKECTSKTCMYAVGNASLDLSHGDSVTDCEPVVLSWLASRTTPQQANFIFRFLTSCVVNQVCPLEIKDTHAVAAACNTSSPSNVTCCRALDQYLQTELQTQMLITNQQAFKCATNLGNLLQNQSVSADLYTLCGIELSDFSLQAKGKEGCLLPSPPTEINMTTGFPTFTCDLNDNILAQWPVHTDDPTSRGLSLYIGSGLRIIGSVLIIMALNV